MARQIEIDFQPGEYELLKTKAEYGWWDSGTLLLTNQRLLWFPGRFASAKQLEIDLLKVASCVQVRSIKYLFMRPSLRLMLKDGAMHELHDFKEIDETQRLILQNMNRRPYQPGTLFVGN